MKAAIIGTGRYIAPHSYDNAFMAPFVGAKESWSAEKIKQLLGIERRTFANRLNGNTGKRYSDSNTREIDIATIAAQEALESAGREAKDIDLLIYVSCTAQRGFNRHFGKTAFDLHLNLGLPTHARVQEIDAGCGGAVHAIEMAFESILSGRRKTILIVASSMPSAYFDRELYTKTKAWLSALIFGDGASAIVLGKSPNGAGILDIVTSVDPAVPLMSLEGNPEQDPELAYSIDGRRVKEAFGLYAKSALGHLRAKVPESADAACYIFHQVNATVLREFVDDMGIPQKKVPVHVDTRGNIAAAATLDILDEQTRSGAIGHGDLVVICAVGAGAQAGAIAVRL